MVITHTTRTLYAFVVLPVFLATTILSCSSSITHHCQVPEHDSHQAMQQELGERFLVALQENDLSKFQACWLDAEDMGSTGAMKDYTAERDRVNAEAFPLLQRAIHSHFDDLTELKVWKVIGQEPSNQMGMPRVGAFEVILVGEGLASLTCRIDDGAFFDGAWYFTDKVDSRITYRTLVSSSIDQMLEDFADDGILHLLESEAHKVIESGEWQLQIWYRAKGSRSEGQHGVLLYLGCRLQPASVGEVRQTPLGELRHYGNGIDGLPWAPTGWNYADPELIRPSWFEEPLQ